MTEPNEQANAGLARDLIAAMQAMRRGDDDTAAALFTLSARDLSTVLAAAVTFITRALSDGGQDVDEWLQARLEEFREA